MAAPLLQLDHIAKSFGAVRALRGVTFDLLPGEVHALAGENGAGKSTLINVIAGVHRPDSGSLLIDGRPIDRLTPAQAREMGIATVHQQPALFPDLTVSENIALALEPPDGLRRIDWKERHERAVQLLHRAGAAIDPRRGAGELSMPEQQLVEIAKALGAGARILILDEPTASLTRKETELLHGVLTDLKARGAGIIYISHRLHEIFAMADRVTVLRDGESIASFPTAETDEASLVRLMVGRETASSYPALACTAGGKMLSVTNLTCDRSRIRNISFDVSRGEVFGIAGLIGAGRTELARTLFGITPADRGEIVIDGKLARIRSLREAIDLGIGYLPEDRRRHGIVQKMSIAANITMALHPRIFPFGFIQPRRERALAESYMRQLAIKAPSPETLCGALSGGNQQKAALSRWLATDPKVLILDEPSQGVDVGAKAEMHNIIRELAAKGVAIILISSDLSEVLGASDRIGVMRSGEMAQIFERKDADADSLMRAALPARGRTVS